MNGREGRAGRKRRVGNEVDASPDAHGRHDEKDHPGVTYVAPNPGAMCCPNARTKCLTKGGMEKNGNECKRNVCKSWLLGDYKTT